jgi:hypothetical protein
LSAQQPVAYHENEILFFPSVNFPWLYFTLPINDPRPETVSRKEEVPALRKLRIHYRTGTHKYI